MEQPISICSIRFKFIIKQSVYRSIPPPRELVIVLHQLRLALRLLFAVALLVQEVLIWDDILEL